MQWILDPKNSPFGIKYDNNIRMIGYGFKRNKKLGCTHWTNYIVPVVYENGTPCALWQMWINITSYWIEGNLLLEYGGVQRIRILHMKNGRLNGKHLLHNKTKSLICTQIYKVWFKMHSNKWINLISWKKYQ
jgi:hypothetical protein